VVGATSRAMMGYSNKGGKNDYANFTKALASGALSMVVPGSLGKLFGEGALTSAAAQVIEYGLSNKITTDGFRSPNGPLNSISR